MVLEKRKSTEAASHTFFENLQEVMDRGLHVIGLFFDLTKAYDIINHEVLLDKLNSYCKINLCFKSYLTPRVQFVEIDQI
jgi:hypothetical protein